MGCGSASGDTGEHLVEPKRREDHSTSPVRISPRIPVTDRLLQNWLCWGGNLGLRRPAGLPDIEFAREAVAVFELASTVRVERRSGVLTVLGPVFMRPTSGGLLDALPHEQPAEPLLASLVLAEGRQVSYRMHEATRSR